RNADLFLDLVVQVLDPGISRSLASDDKHLLQAASGFARDPCVEIENRQHLSGRLIAKELSLRGIFDPQVLGSEYVGGCDAASRQLFDIRALVIAKQEDGERNDNHQADTRVDHSLIGQAGRESLQTSYKPGRRAKTKSGSGLSHRVMRDA